MTVDITLTVKGSVHWMSTKSVCWHILLKLLIHTESGKVQEVYGVLMPLNLWLTEQQHKLDAMRPAAVLTAPLINQITETDVRTLLVRILAI